MNSRTNILQLGDVDNNEKKFRGAIVIQGPYIKPQTERSVRIFLERNPPEILVIVSTYIAAEKLLSPFEKEILISKKGPYVGRLVFLFSDIPTSSEFYKTNYWNQNFQRLTSYTGIKFAHDLEIPYVLKCRSDGFLGKDDICFYLKRYLDEYHPPPLSSLNKGRIIVSDQTKVWKENLHCAQPIGDYHVADYWLFAHTEDLLKYFDMSPGSSWDGGKGIGTKYAVETNLALCWMKNVGIREYPEEKIFGLAKDFLIILSNIDVEFVWLKHWQKYEDYIFYRCRYLEKSYKEKTRGWKLFTHERWLQLVTSSRSSVPVAETPSS